MYYPQSQIISNLYTNGNEFAYVSSPQTEYIGYYWKTSRGQFFSGKTPQDTSVQELVILSLTDYATPNQNPVLNSPNFTPNDFPAVEYPKYNYKEVISPTYSPTLPTQQDYQLGEMRRYFCKKSNEILYLEISIDTYNKLVSKDSTIAFQYYIPFNLPWQITGTKEQVFTVNRNIVELTMKQQKLPMFDMYLKKDYTKYTA
jgi:hypothetical protein